MTPKLRPTTSVAPKGASARTAECEEVKGAREEEDAYRPKPRRPAKAREGGLRKRAGETRRGEERGRVKEGEVDGGFPNPGHAALEQRVLQGMGPEGPQNDAGKAQGGARDQRKSTHG